MHLYNNRVHRQVIVLMLVVWLCFCDSSYRVDQNFTPMTKCDLFSGRKFLAHYVERHHVVQGFTADNLFFNACCCDTDVLHVHHGAWM